MVRGMGDLKCLIVCMCVCVCPQRSESHPLGHYPPCSLKRLGLLTSDPQGSCWLCLLADHECTTMPSFLTWVLEIQFRTSCLYGKDFYQASHLPDPWSVFFLRFLIQNVQYVSLICKSKLPFSYEASSRQAGALGTVKSSEGSVATKKLHHCGNGDYKQQASIVHPSRSSTFFLFFVASTQVPAAQSCPHTSGCTLLQSWEQCIVS